MENTLAINCSIEHQTEKAVLIDDESQKIWLPRSVVEVDRSEGGRPEWLAVKQGLL
jgi:hypothetical protein